MEIIDLENALKGEFQTLHQQFIAGKTGLKYTDLAAELDPKKHRVADKTKRPDKVVTTDDGSSVVEVARLPIPMQKRIVRMAVAFLCGNPVQLFCTPEEGAPADLLAVLQKTWMDNKLVFKDRKLLRHVMGETEVAELWYTEEAEPDYWKGTPNEGTRFKLRMKVLAPSLGDSLYPIFNGSGDMIAFGRGYSLNLEGKVVEHFDLYTAKEIRKYVKGDAGWSSGDTKPHAIGKIPIIYHSQEAPEWYDVQEMIERLEKLISNHADTNDYHMSPTILVKGDVKGFAKKGESGKILELDPGAEATYMSWDKSPESLKMEYENLRSEILANTDTPDISFDKVKGLGTFSGIALKMLFMGAHMKASEKEGEFGEGIQRRINYLLAAHKKLNLKSFESVNLVVEPRFTYFLPKNEVELIDMLSQATTGDRPIMSQRTAVKHNPLVQDPEAEMDLLDEEAESKAALNRQME